MDQSSRIGSWLLAFSAITLVPAYADVKLAGIFGDHMLLERNTHVRLWGTAAPGELIRVRPSWYENDAAATAGPDGKFSVALTTPGASGPHTIRVTGKNEVTLSDVMIGEVWLASGQSNMEMGVGFLHDGYSGVKDWQRELTDAARPRIRLFTVENTASAAPTSDVKGVWRVADAASVKEFSATGWFFAKQLEHDLNVPIGVVASDWGGTPAEAWTSAKGLAPFSQYADAVASCARLAGDPNTSDPVHANEQMVWGRAVLKLDPLSAAHAEAASFDDSHWTDATVPGSWTGDLGNFDGIVWMRRQVEIPAAWVGRELELDLGPIDDDDRTWFDGELVGATEGWDTPRKYPIPAARVQAGKATIAVRILDTGGFGGFHGEAAAMLLRPKTGAEKISLAGSWRMSRGAALAELPPKPPVFALGGNTPTALFNGMIAPLAEFRFAGAIWYQGESNVGRAEEYAKLFPAMIQDWRANFHSELPFLYVQIAPFGYGNDSGAAGDLRAAQAEALALPKTGMAITVDIGDPADIHPKNKQEVGKRLAALALAPDFRVHYPLADAPHNDAGRVKLEFHEVLEACGPSVFELAGADGKFRPATQEVSPEGEVFVFSTEVSAPTRLRYAWGAAAAGSLRSAETKLPVAPFKADCGP